jgi:CTP synthase (UTP-ammonia lyase)
MEKTIRIAVLGNYNFAYHSHNATNKAIQHCEKILSQPINFYWLNEDEFCDYKVEDVINDFDGVYVAPGPFLKPFFFNEIFKTLLKIDIPVFGTGEVYRMLIQYHFEHKGYDLTRDRIISDNLIEGNHFSEIVLDKLSSESEKVYMHRGGSEYTSVRYSILPQYSDILSEEFEIGARNQYFDPEIIKLKTHPFFLFTMFCPQITSTEDIPHPLITYFIKNVIRISDIKATDLLG